MPKKTNTHKKNNLAYLTTRNHTQSRNIISNSLTKNNKNSRTKSSEGKNSVFNSSRRNERSRTPGKNSISSSESKSKSKIKNFKSPEKKSASEIKNSAKKSEKSKNKMKKVKNNENFGPNIKTNLNQNFMENSDEEKKIEEDEQDDFFEEDLFDSINKEEDNFSEVGTDYLPCRQNEQDEIYNFITRGLQTNGNYSSLYIAGMPGTGKTASVRTVINILESEIDKTRKTRNINSKLKENCIVPFQKLIICGMDYPNILTVFRTIYNFIFAKKKSQGEITKYIQILDDFFKERKKYDSSNYLNDPTNSHIILVIDEIDILLNKSQNLLYNIFNWTTYVNSKLIIISISNTFDFPNKLLPKVKSRMGGFNKLMFKPYTKDELYIILKSKGIDTENFTSDALRISCLKVASLNGDLRRTFQILSKAKEIAELENKNNKKGEKKLIDKVHIIKACNDLFRSRNSNIIKSLHISEKIILISILAKIKDNSDKKINLGDLFDKKNIFINKYNEKNDDRDKLSINWEEFQQIIYNLLRIRLLSCTDYFQKNFVENYIVIKFYIDDFICACEDDKELKPVMEYFKEIVQ